MEESKSKIEILPCPFCQAIPVYGRFDNGDYEIKHKTGCYFNIIYCAPGVKIFAENLSLWNCQACIGK